jgi:hypothetical protein
VREFVTVTESGLDQGSGRCRWCRRSLPARTGPGRPRRFCGHACRQRDYEARRRAGELALGDRELIVARSALDRLRDELYVLACAVEDVERDLAAADAPGPTELHEALSWLLEAARPLCTAERADLTAARADRPAARADRQTET